MNINEQMHDLATMGGLAYQADDQLISSLVSRTRRKRAARQSVSSAAGTIGAVALGLLATQVYAATKDDPAFRDRNIINNDGKLNPIDLYRAKYGNDNPTRTYNSNVNVDDIVAKLRESANKPKDPGSSGQVQNPGGTTGTTKPGGSTGSTGTGGTKPGGGSACTSTPNPGEGWECDSATGEWKVKSGYFMFGNGHVYPMVQWTDAATGLKSWGNWSGTSWGWETKAIHMGESTDTSFGYDDDLYIYMGSWASWSGTTCNGIRVTKWNADFKASCMPESRVQASGYAYISGYKMKDGIVLILQDTYKKWCDCTGQYEDPANPPEGIYWDGSQWVVGTPPA